MNDNIGIIRSCMIVYKEWGISICMNLVIVADNGHQISPAQGEAHTEGRRSNETKSGRKTLIFIPIKTDFWTWCFTLVSLFV